ncbi:MAG: HAD family hydrolase [Nitrososphaerales archaeon]
MLSVLSFDLDGTLIKKGLDDVFWQELIPKIYAEKRKIGFDDARRFILEEYDRIGSDDPRWYIPEYWFERFDLPGSIPEVLGMVQYAEGVYDDVPLLSGLSKRYRVVISTNNPRIILEHKLKVLKQVEESVSDTFSSVSDFNRMVKSTEFYTAVCERMGIRPEQMLHVGDDPRHDLAIPKSLGVKALLIDRERKITGEDVIHSLAELERILQAGTARL